jgi:hypothetical protein
MAQESDAALADRARYGGGAAPVFDFAPCGGIVVKLARDQVEIDAGAREGVGDLGHAADRTVRQPLGGIRGFIIERGRGLQVQHQHRRARLLHDRQNLRGCGVGGHVAENQIHVFARKSCPAARAPSGVSTKTGGKHFGAEPADAIFHGALISFQALLHARKLGPVGGQSDSEYADARGHGWLRIW